MKVIIQKPNDDEKDSIIVRCRYVDPDLIALLNAAVSHKGKLVAHLNGNTHLLSPTDVYYIDTVDSKTFLYCENTVYDSKQKLYELEEFLEYHDFLRVSKSLIINLRKVKFLSPAFHGRLQAELKNGEKVVISRQYVPALKRTLGI